MQPRPHKTAPAVKKLVILGSTGSIGENALRVVAAFPNSFQIIGLAAGQDSKRILEQAQQFKVKHIALGQAAAARRAAELAPSGITVKSGPQGLEEIAALAEADIVLAAVVGMAGLKPILAALNRGSDVALASKEALVVAGPIILKACAKSGARLLPVDSEHCALFQCLAGQSTRQVQRLLLTASGGPFANKAKVDFERVTVAEALRHPRWNMGRKISVDSATMMNKGLELMEAHWLFQVGLDQIDVLIHPESIVHSLVEFVDGGMLAQLSVSDMRLAIQYALFYPERMAGGGLPKLDLTTLGALHFVRPDEQRFPCLALARAAGKAAGTMPAVLNAANEVAVQAFLDGRLSFAGIWRLVELVMQQHSPLVQPDLAAIIHADQWARRQANLLVNKA